MTAVTAQSLILRQQSLHMLTAIKLLHTVVWAVLVGCILSLPLLAFFRRFRWAGIATVVVLLECTALAINGGRCPLTDLASKYTLDRAFNFDIYLPNWLAGHNKAIFGTLFVAGELVVAGCWLSAKSGVSFAELPMMRALNAGVLYFDFVFAAGFVLGTFRTLWVVPRIGTRTAELLEMPLMLVVTIWAARWTVLHRAVSHALSTRLAMGSIALFLMLIAELGFVLWIRGLSISNYLATRDPVSGTVYYLMLVVFAAMPLLVVRS